MIGVKTGGADEFAGMTTLECPAACAQNRAAQNSAQKRLNEIDAEFPRRPVHNRRLGPVVEDDTLWLPRVPANIADEYRKLCVVRDGCCAISGGPACAHPMKGGLQSELSNPETEARFERAKHALIRQKLDIKAA